MGYATHGVLCPWGSYLYGAWYPRVSLPAGHNARRTLRHAAVATPIPHRLAPRRCLHVSGVDGHAEDPAVAVLQRLALGQHVQRRLRGQRWVRALWGGVGVTPHPSPGPYLAAAVGDVLSVPPGRRHPDGAHGAGDVDHGRAAAAQPLPAPGLRRLLQQGQEGLGRARSQPQASTL